MPTAPASRGFVGLPQEGDAATGKWDPRAANCASPGHLPVVLCSLYVPGPALPVSASEVPAFSATRNSGERAVMVSVTVQSRRDVERSRQAGQSGADGLLSTCRMCDSPEPPRKGHGNTWCSWHRFSENTDKCTEHIKTTHEVTTVTARFPLCSFSSF